MRETLDNMEKKKILISPGMLFHLFFKK
jgi:hypothetical protein